MNTLDHGELNIPGRTSRINADLDKHLASQVVKAKAEARKCVAKLKADKAKAAVLLAELGPAIVAQNAPGIANRQSLTLTQACRAISRELGSMVKWEPAKFLALVDRHQRETSPKE